MRCGGLLAGLVLAVVGCTHDELMGPGGGAEVSVTTPSGVQMGLVRVIFTLQDEDNTSANIAVRYSVNGGVSFLSATPGAGSVPTSGLAVSPGGTTHVFVWDSGADAASVRSDDVRIRITVRGGNSQTTQSFSLHNTRFLLVTHDVAPGRASLVRADVLTGGLDNLGSIGLGGDNPWGVLFLDGRFYVANRGSHSISVLALDEVAEGLFVVAGTPFASDGTRPRYLASDEEHLFVSNVGGSTITIFDIDADTGALTLNADSGVAASGCRDLWVRSGRLYVASETRGEILVFDIGATGRLQVSGHSPVSTGGLVSPVGMIGVGTRLYAANYSVGTLAGFTIAGDGGLVAIAGSPFSFSGSEALEISASAAGDRVFVATGGTSSLASLELDILGIATQDASSPHSTGGAPNTVAAIGSIVVVGSAASEAVEAYVVSSSGSLSAGGDNPLAIGNPIGRVGFSD